MRWIKIILTRQKPDDKHDITLRTLGCVQYMPLLTSLTNVNVYKHSYSTRTKNQNTKLLFLTYEK